MTASLRLDSRDRWRFNVFKATCVHPTLCLSRTLSSFPAPPLPTPTHSAYHVTFAFRLTPYHAGLIRFLRCARRHMRVATHAWLGTCCSSSVFSIKTIDHSSRVGARPPLYMLAVRFFISVRVSRVGVLKENLVRRALCIKFSFAKIPSLFTRCYMASTYDPDLGRPSTQFQPTPIGPLW